MSYFFIFVTAVCLTVPPWKPGTGLELYNTLMQYMYREVVYA